MMRPSEADTRKALFALATNVRLFLQTVWPLWHEQSDRTLPVPLSRYTCGRSSFLLRDALRLEGFKAEFQTGNPFDAQGLIRIRPSGFLSGGRWESHSWVCCEQLLIDVTADQFGAAPVIVTGADDRRYRADISDAADASSIAARHAVVASVWPQWLAYSTDRAFGI